jgi:hypothetical protein
MSRCSLLAGEIDKIIGCFHEAKWKPIHGQNSTWAYSRDLIANMTYIKYLYCGSIGDTKYPPLTSLGMGLSGIFGLAVKASWA